MNNIKSLLKNRIIQLILLGLLLLAIPLGVYLAQQQQKLKSRAASTGTAQLTLVPSTRDDLQVSGTNSTFTVDLVLTVPQGGGSVSAVDATVNFNNQLLRMESFADPVGGSRFSNVLMPRIVDTINNGQGTFKYLAVDKTSSVISGNVVLGRMTFRVNRAGSSNITFADSSRYTIPTDRKLFIPITTASGTYSTAGASPAPSASPGVSPSPVNVVCNSVNIEGLSRSSGESSEDGGPVYNLIWRGPGTKNVPLIIGRTPTTAEISLPAGSIVKQPSTAPDIGVTTYYGDITLNFPVNNTSTDYVYEIQTRVTVGTSGVNCRIAEIRMPGVTVSPAPSVSPSPTARTRIRGDASQPYNYCVDTSDFLEWLAENQGHSRRKSDDGLYPRADWAKPNENPDGTVQPDGIVDDLYDLGAYYEGARDHPCSR